MQVQGEGVEGLSGFHYLKGFTLVPRTSLPYWEQLGFNEADSMANGRQSYSRWRWGMLKGKKL